MATLTHPQTRPTEAEVKAAEDALLEIFAEHLETLTPEKREEIAVELRANAEKFGE